VAVEGVTVSREEGGVPTISPSGHTTVAMLAVTFASETKGK
jgi:hypothetical protein